MGWREIPWKWRMSAAGPVKRIQMLAPAGRDPAIFRLDYGRGVRWRLPVHSPSSGFCTGPADAGSTDMPAPLVDWLAEHLGIDIVRQWSLDRSYLELLTTAQLQELAAEWKLQPAVTKRGELVEWLANAGREKPCPKAVRGIKAVSTV